MISQHSKHGPKNVENPNSVRGLLRHQSTHCSFSVFSYAAASAHAEVVFSYVAASVVASADA